ncbi:MAG: hypothetical protein QOE06_424, partial [Thermoleophilaceae bacterium]|nr:hypothetical protein [Thermoleophilaceae bacterium]
MTSSRLRTTLAAAAALLTLAFPAAAAAKGGDRDHDKMPDRWERAHKLNPKKNDAAKDLDRDGLRNLAEYRAKTDPSKADTNANGVSDPNEDPDRDHVDNGNEDREHTNPVKKDSNRDGVPDGSEDPDTDGLNNQGEDTTGNDPIVADTDGDGVPDGSEDAGRIESFTGGVLTVRVAGGTTVTGRVDDTTEIDCSSKADLEDWSGDSAGGNSKGPGSRELDVRGHARRLTDSPLGGDQPTTPSEPAGTGTPDDPSAGDPATDDPATDPSGDGSGDDSGDTSADDSGDTSGDGSSCGVEALVPGAVVHGAELELVGGGPVFTSI